MYRSISKVVLFKNEKQKQLRSHVSLNIRPSKLMFFFVMT